MSQDDSYFRLRIPSSLKVMIEGAASENRRSMNAEIIARLLASFEQCEYDLTAVGEMVVNHEDRIKDLERQMANAAHMAGWRDYPENE